MILITGGAGFIGSNLVAALSQKTGAPKITVVDRLGIDDKWKNLSNHLVHQIIEPENLDRYLSKNDGSIEYVFHLGAISSTIEKDVDLILRNNFNLSLSLWNWCTKHRIPFIYASSAATYGDGKNGFNDDFDPIELSKLKPLNPYGWSKHLFDKLVNYDVLNGSAHPPQWAGLKFFNVFVLPPKKITRSGNPKYMYRYPYQRNRSFERMKHGNIPTVADKRICFKFFVLKFLSIVFITLHHFLRENSFMISQPPLLYKEKL